MEFLSVMSQLHSLPSFISSSRIWLPWTVAITNPELLQILRTPTTQGLWGSTCILFNSLSPPSNEPVYSSYSFFSLHVTRTLLSLLGRKGKYEASPLKTKRIRHLCFSLLHIQRTFRLFARRLVLVLAPNSLFLSRSGAFLS